MSKFHPAPALTMAVLLALGLVGCSKTPAPGTTTNTMGEVVEKHPEDLLVNARVKEALLKDNSLKAFEISVATTKGDVRLNGVLETQAQIDTAIKLARATEGVHSIHDELTLKK